ncbi:MAG TPA: hypothetical protein VMY06_05120 [Sedimentisphaerales bacterium]|nr:hypothetical protein [Sedimentisphaerales bacterium]
MSGTDGDIEGRQAGEGPQKEKGGRCSHFTKVGLLTVGLVTVVFVGVLLAAYLAETTQPSGRRFGLRPVIHRCLVLLRLREPPASRVVFGTNLSGLAKAVRVYANDDPQGRIPPGDRWCDILIQNDFVTPKQFVHRRSDSIEGESDVAMNVNAAGKSLTELPADMVLFFETDFGKDWRGTRGLMKDRGFYKVAPCADPNTKVYTKRWNQVGGPEILTTSHNRGRGCNVAFVDTHVKFVKTADLAKLKWKPDPNER